MLTTIFISLVPMAVSIAILFVISSVVVAYQQRKNRHRHSPLTSKLLRGPGHALVQELDDANFDVATHFFMIWFIPVFIFSMHVSGPYFLGIKDSLTTIVINVLATIGIEIYAVYKLIGFSDRRRRIREGYEAENAVGSELNQLMLNGAYVFHDLQAENFNIDHLIVSSKGVFCVETKSRVKYAELKGKQNAQMEFDGNALKFPSHVETEPVEQVRRNAKWVKDWLTKAIGENVDVRCVIALPGWFVTTTSRSEILVINGKNCRSFFDKVPVMTALNPTMIQRIVYQVEQRCRDIEPINYRKAAKAFPSK